MNKLCSCAGQTTLVAVVDVCISHLFLSFEVSKIFEKFSLRRELSRLQEM